MKVYVYLEKTSGGVELVFKEGKDKVCSFEAADYLKAMDWAREILTQQLLDSVVSKEVAEQNITKYKDLLLSLAEYRRNV